MKAQRESGEGPTQGRDPAPTQIADDDAAPRDAIQLGNEASPALLVEVVQQLGAENEIDAVIRHGERQRVAADRRVYPMAGRGDQSESAIEGNGLEHDASSPRNLACAPWQIGQAGADIQQRCPRHASIPQVIEEWTEREHNSATTTEEHVGAFDIAVRPFAERGIDFRVVENFERCRSHRSSCAYPPR